MGTFSRFAAAFLMLAAALTVHAADRKFPYEAIIDIEDGENVRSGPGPKYYPTVKLKKGDRVMVHRHDPGGWCMISPPTGSFSWVRAEHIKKNANGTGVLKTSGVVVHVGSEINPDEYTTVQANLSQGDAVEILGEKEFQFEDGPRLMYKISPVKREWRWIARKSIVAVDALQSEPFPTESPKKKRTGPVAQRDDEGFAKPVSTGTAGADVKLESTGRSQKSSTEEIAVRETNADSELTAAARSQLDGIDRQFRDMIHQDPSTWDLDSLETQYQQLDDATGLAPLSNAISLRQDAVKRYRKIHADYVSFFKSTAESKSRDAQTQVPAVRPPAAAGTDDKTQTRSPVAQPSAPARSNQPAAGAAPGFDGAGIVQKMSQTFPGGPQFVLVTPEGRMLSFLQGAPGIDLNRYVGRAMGVSGQRVHRDDWNADVITVRGLQPVQLRGSR
jgi:uncharacterized protein YgiM (DUF1202 family)